MSASGDVLRVLQEHPHESIAAKPAKATTLHAAMGTLHVGVAQRLAWMLQLARVAKHCHMLHVALPWLCASNIALPSGRARSCITVDPSAASALSAEGKLKPSQQSLPAYAPPELYQSNAYDAFKADIWIIGVVFFIIVTGTYPFVDSDPADLLRKICSEQVQFPSSVPAAAEALVQSMLAKNPAGRPSIDEVINRCGSLIQQYFHLLHASTVPSKVHHVPPHPTRPTLRLPTMASDAGCKHAATDDADAEDMPRTRARLE